MAVTHTTHADLHAMRIQQCAILPILIYTQWHRRHENTPGRVGSYMYTLRSTLTRYPLALLSLMYASQVFAADPTTPQPPAWPWWHQASGPSFWWIFPLLFFVMMIVMFIFMMRGGGMGCMWRDRMMDRPELRDAMKRSSSEQSESALDILDKRYARGEIEKQEYEEKKAALTRSE